MSFRLGPDGKPIEVATSYGDRDRGKNDERTVPPKGTGDAAATQPNRSDGATKPPAVDLFNHIAGATTPRPDIRPGHMAITPEPPTRPVHSPAANHAQPGTMPPAGGMPQQNVKGAVADEAKTTINFGKSTTADSEAYVCGWFVIIDGPGKGKSLSIGAGQSAVSRSPSERIPINFGDSSITSKQQLLVLFDDETRDFFVAPGNGSSLNRLNGQIIGSQMQLNSGDVVKVGATSLRFVAFCDSQFSWS
jgi:hypothetical protein